MLTSLSIARKLKQIAWRMPWLGLCFAAAFSMGAERRQAIASCGDYVMVGGHSLHEQDPAAPLAPATVCRGPNCQKQTPAPMDPTRGLPLARHVERACRVASGDPPGMTITWLMTDCRSLPLDGHQFRIEHPPRLCA